MIFSFVGDLGRYEIRQAHRCCFPVWLHSPDESLPKRLPSCYDIRDAFFLVEWFDAEPFEVSLELMRGPYPE